MCQNRGMKTERFAASAAFRGVSLVLCLALVAGCATPPAGPPEEAAAAKLLRDARSDNLPPETRAADYLQAAALTAPTLGSGTQSTPARATYNAAAAEITV